jgi:hypothetical protein
MRHRNLFHRKRGEKMEQKLLVVQLKDCCDMEGNIIYMDG